MNRTWMGVSHADKTGNSFDYNTFLHADLFSNETLHILSNDIHVIYEPYLSSTLISPYNQNYSNINQSSASRFSIAHGIATPLVKLILTFLMSTMAFLTVAGNFLVILAFICEPTIRTYSNYFILNLSIADLLIGVIWWVHDIIFPGELLASPIMNNRDQISFISAIVRSSLAHCRNASDLELFVLNTSLNCLAWRTLH